MCHTHLPQFPQRVRAGQVFGGSSISGIYNPHSAARRGTFAARRGASPDDKGGRNESVTHQVTEQMSVTKS